MIAYCPTSSPAILSSLPANPAVSPFTPALGLYVNSDGSASAYFLDALFAVTVIVAGVIVIFALDCNVVVVPPTVTFCFTYTV